MELSIDDVEVLGEALFDFSTVEDLIKKMCIVIHT